MDLNKVFKDRNKMNGIPMTTMGDITNMMCGLYDDYDNNVNSGFNQSFTNHKREKSNASILYNGNSYGNHTIK